MGDAIHAVTEVGVVSHGPRIDQVCLPVMPSYSHMGTQVYT